MGRTTEKIPTLKSDYFRIEMRTTDAIWESLGDHIQPYAQRIIL